MFCPSLGMHFELLFVLEMSMYERLKNIDFYLFVYLYATLNDLNITLILTFQIK